MDKFIYIVNELSEVFNGDVVKVLAWLETSNLNFGGASPIQLIKSGRIDKVVEFVEDRKLR